MDQGALVFVDMINGKWHIGTSEEFTTYRHCTPRKSGWQARNRIAISRQRSVISKDGFLLIADSRWLKASKRLVYACTLAHYPTRICFKRVGHPDL